jgi:hypothetical protein
MPEYLENPRRVPRVEVRCTARIFLATGAVETTTEDIGSRGCRVVLPEPAQRGDAVGLALNAPRYPPTLRVEGRVAWASPAAPWRVGIAYAAQALPEAARWFEGLRQSLPELFSLGRPLQRLPVDGMVFLGPVPRLVDLSEDELVVLRAIGTGILVGDLRTALSRSWPRMQRALFALLAQGHVIVSRALATHPVNWKHVLGEPLRAGGGLIAVEGDDDLDLVTDGPAPLGEPVTASPAPASSRVTAKVPVVPAPRPVPRRISGGVEPPEAVSAARPAIPTPPAPRQAPPPVAASAPAAPAATPPPLAWQEHPPTARAAVAAAPRPEPVRQGPHGPDFTGAGVGWRASARRRTPEAEDLLKLGLAELEAHRSHGALALLRRALSLAPGDPEIATAIGRAMRRDEAAKV